MHTIFVQWKMYTQTHVSYPIYARCLNMLCVVLELHSVLSCNVIGNLQLFTCINHCNPNNNNNNNKNRNRKYKVTATATATAATAAASNTYMNGKTFPIPFPAAYHILCQKCSARYVNRYK